jgi:hypothetical protein
MLAAAFVLASAGAARSDDAEKRDAQARFEEGLARVRAGDLEAARTSFTQAYAVLHKPDILWNLALCEQKTGHVLDALAHFKTLVHDAETATDRTGAQKHVSELMAQTAHIEIVAPAGAQLSVDGAPEGIAPLPDAIDVAPGSHRVDMRTPQGEAKYVNADTAIGTVARVSFVSGGTPVVAPTAPTPPAAETQPPSPDTTAAPPHGGTFWDARGITVVTIGGLAVVSAGVALGLGQVSNSDANTAASLRAQNHNCNGITTGGCGQLESTTQAQHSAYVASTGMWIAAGVLAAGAVAAWFLWPRPSPGGTASVTVVPGVGPGSAGVVAVGSF